MHPFRPELADHPDRLRWNARYGGGFVPSFTPHPLAVQALAMPLPPGGVLELACGPSGSALAAAAAGRHVTAVDAADVALGLLAAQASRAGSAGSWSWYTPTLRPGGPSRTGTRWCSAPATGIATSSPWRPWLPCPAERWPGRRSPRRRASSDRRFRRTGAWLQVSPATLLPVGYEVLINKPASQERGRKWQFLARRAAAS